MRLFHQRIRRRGSSRHAVPAAKPFLVSKPLLDRTVKPANIVATSIGGHLLRGKSENIELFALERSTTTRRDADGRVRL
jgi:hypothetical protein